MKKIAGRAALILLLFAAVVGGIAVYDYIRKNRAESYETMSQASLPLVSLVCSEGAKNELHGYVDDMELSSMRDTITPLTDSHELSIEVSFASRVGSASYEVRSLDGSRLVERGEINDWEELSEDTKGAQLKFSSLVDDSNEYQLHLVLELENKSVNYYGRIIYLANGATQSLLNFPKDFINASIAGDAAFIVNYIQPNDTMSTTDYGHVSNHSRSSMLTWGSLEAGLAGDISTKITELSSTQATLTVTYPLTLTIGDDTKECTVTEHYVVRCRDGVIYLLDFERYTRENFSTARLQFDDGNIWLGITNEDPVKMESDDGTVQAYIYDRQLWCYDDELQLMSPIYTYLDGDDARCSWDHHELQLVRVNNDGTIYFMVYGYHNRGNHEGKVGVSFCKYSVEENIVDEIFYIPVNFSEQVLEQNMGTIAYVTEDSDLLYLLYGSTVYSIDLASGEKVELAAAQSAGSFYRNEDSSLLGWQEGDADFPDKLIIVNLKSAKTYEINADDGEYLQLQGFMGDDLIYGAARKADAVTQAGEVTAKPMYKLEIVHFADDMESAGSYEQSGLFILGTEIAEEKIVVSRAEITNGTITEHVDDQIFLNDRDSAAETSAVRTKQLDGFLRTASIRSDIDTSKLGSPSQRCGISSSQSAYTLSLSGLNEDANTYYVFSRGYLSAAMTRLSSAIEKAYDEMGVVVSSSGSYVWTRGTRPLNKTITVEEQSCEAADESLKTSLEILVKSEGGDYGNAAKLLDDGNTPAEAIAECMNGEGRVLDLRGCTVGQMLYYISLGHPVLAVIDDARAVVLTGYDSRNITIYDPFGELTGQLTQDEANEYFTQHDNNFICFID